jgi:hypothetical protein
MVKNALISDIILRITKSKPSDDLEIEPSQVAFWISNIGNEVIQKYLDNKLKSGKSIDPFFYTKESYNMMNKEDDPLIDDDKDRIYITLESQVLDLYCDNGVIRVFTTSGEKVNKTSLDSVDIVEDLEFAKSSSDNPLYYRDGSDKLVIMGIPYEMRSNLELIVWYVAKLDLECLSDTDEVKIPDELLPIILDEVEIVARREFSGAQDVENNSMDDVEQANG